MEANAFLQISADCEIRGSDCHGQGHYLAPRGSRKHKGIDPVCDGGTLIGCASDGVVTKIGYPYRMDDEVKGYLRYVEIKVGSVFERYFYIQPFSVRVGDKVKKGQTIGIAQGLADIYPGITDHVHFEVRRSKKDYLDPNEYLKGLSNG